MTKITGIFTAAAAAAMLSISPVAAQEVEGVPGDPNPQIEQRLGINTDERLEMAETFRTMAPTATTVGFDTTLGATVPTTVTTQPVPDEIIAVAPGVERFHYVALPNNQIALVDPDTRVIVDLF